MTHLRWRKIRRDLWRSKTQVILVVLPIAIGVFAIGTITRARLIVSRELTDQFIAVNPANGLFFTAETFGDKLVEVVENIPEVEAAEGRHQLTVRFKKGPDEWATMRLFAVDDFDELGISKMLPQAGEWPPAQHTLLLERASLDQAGAGIGDALVLEMADGNQRLITVAGVVHDLNQFPSNLNNIVYGYVTSKTLEWLGGSQDYNVLYVTVAQNKLDEPHIRQVMGLVIDKIEQDGLTISQKQMPKPNSHPLNDILQSVLFVLGTLGLLSLLLSTFLVINIMSGLLARQVPEIGVLKALGAPGSMVTRIYIGMVIVFCVLALGLSLPLGLLAARAYSQLMASLLNFDIADFSLPPQLYFVELFAGLVVPISAALYPILVGARTTVREAISQNGAGVGSFGTARFDQLLGRVPGLSISIRYALRNILRRKARLAFTLTTLIIAGAIFIGVMGTRASVQLTSQSIADYWRFDTSLQFPRPYRLAKVERLASKIPEVMSTEGYLVRRGARLRPDGSETENSMTYFGVQPVSNFLHPTVLHGRWLSRADTNSFVVNIQFLEAEPDVSLGDEIVLKIEGREIAGQMVGVVTGQAWGGMNFMDPMAYMNYDYMAQAMGEMGRIDKITIETGQDDSAAQAKTTRALEEQFRRSGLRLNLTQTHTQMWNGLQNAFGITLSVLFIMALLFAVVGGLGLTSMMSLNVLERTKEIGVLRSVGSSDKIVYQVIMVEAIVTGLLSWFLGAILAIPLSKFLSNAIGQAIIDLPLDYRFPTSGILIWLLISLGLSALASILPARAAARLSVREVLAYE